ncbi:MAG: peptidyl-tRNA hydrolase [Pseudonocardiaceae bacterium]|nr:peptidyl-tRNA hydrolase [Pseudonocardiaceae bacterium]
MNVLEPLAARYASWLGLPAERTASTEDEDPEQVRAMPLVLRIERAAPPTRTALLEAAAAASVAVCLDPRAQPGGEWHDEVASWVAGRIRKVARRARGAHWRAVQELAGVTIEVGNAQVRALLPGLVTETPHEVKRLQISGSELPDEDGAEAVPEPGAPRLWLNPVVEMTAGKAAAQVGHATMIMAALLGAEGAAEPLAEWARWDYRCSVRTPSAGEWKAIEPAGDPAAAWRERRVVAVRDAGFTEVAPGTITVLARASGSMP